MRLKKHWWSILYAVVLAVYTAYVALDTFVIPRVYTQLDTQTALPTQTQSTAGSAAIIQTASADELQGSQEVTAQSTAVSSDNSYDDGQISIRLTSYRQYDTDIYVADVTLASAACLQTALANNTYGRNVTQTTSAIAQSVSAVLAVNGDFYGSRQTGYVIRDGVVYRATASAGQEDLVIYADGSFGIIQEDEVSAETLAANGAQQVLSFGPALISQGAVAVTENEEVGRARASNPRTAVGVLSPLHYVFVVADGRTSASAGLSLYQLATFMQSLGVETAYNLDGGGSSTLYFNGEVINNPTGSGRGDGERSVSDIVYVGEAT